MFQVLEFPEIVRGGNVVSTLKRFECPFPMCRRMISYRAGPPSNCTWCGASLEEMKFMISTVRGRQGYHVRKGFLHDRIIL